MEQTFKSVRPPTDPSAASFIHSFNTYRDFHNDKEITSFNERLTQSPTLIKIYLKKAEQENKSFNFTSEILDDRI